MIDLKKTQVSEDYIRENKDSVNWEDVSEYQILSESFMDEFSDYVNWRVVTRTQKLSEAFIRKHIEEIKWFTTNILYHQTLSEGFIREFKDDFLAGFWNLISGRVILSESFIEEFIERINWNCLSFGNWDLLSEAFIEKHIDRFNLDTVWRHQNLSKKFIEKNIDKFEPVNWGNNTSNLAKIPVDIIMENISELCLCYSKHRLNLDDIRDIFTEEQFLLIKNCFEILY